VAGASGSSYDLVDWSHLGAERYLSEGVTITDEEFRSLADEHDAVLLGALGDPRVPGNEHAKDILLGLRFRLDLYVNFRPCTLIAPALCPLKDADPSLRLEIFRENTEGERSEERRVGKECRSRWTADHGKSKREEGTM